MKIHPRWAALVCAALATLARGQTPPPTTPPAPQPAAPAPAPTAAPTQTSPTTLATTVDRTSPLSIVMRPFLRVAIDYNQDPVAPQKSRWGPIASAFYPASKGLGVYVGASLVCTPSIEQDSTTGREVRSGPARTPRSCCSPTSAKGSPTADRPAGRTSARASCRPSCTASSRTGPTT
jgi:hypothetical protein